MLRVKGESMTGAAICDGDLVVVRCQPVAENGEIVAAQLGEGETAGATVKTLQRLDGRVGAAAGPGRLSWSAARTRRSVFE
jgi:repressor LexA